ncbi:MAG: hypothetical protein GC158_06880 [Cyanobacteria bacterium RI_101]|nr:hypothetical protein [Cyanobacteria bacterium RI_101]
MAQTANQLLETFRTKVILKEEVRSKMESLVVTRSIDEMDILFIYDGLFLSLFTDFEEFLEKLFIGLLNGTLRIQGKKVDQFRKIKISPQEQTEIVIRSGKDYLDWLPYEQHTEKRAKIYFHNGSPFTQLNSDQKRVLQDYHKIRNAIAHKSSKSQREFNKVIQNNRLSPLERTPAGYLRSKPQGNETQYQIATTELISMARTLIECPPILLKFS